MATLVLGVAGAAIGNALLPGGISFLGATITGAAIGGAAGSFAGGQVDSALLGPEPRHLSGPRLSELQLQTSTEGAPVLRVFGRARVAGQVIWAANFKEVKQTSDVPSGGKGTGSSTVTEFLYFASFAVGLCEGEIGGIGRVWADGKPLDLSGVSFRVYTGSETQSPDPLIETVEGEGAAPAYRGLAYVVFEDLPLADFGNRVPQLGFEVFRTVPSPDGQGLDALLKGVNLIPGSGEFALATERVTRSGGAGVTLSENVHNAVGEPNIVVSLDQLQAQAPACQSVILVVCWFGTDLRCSECEIRPGVEVATKTTSPQTWIVDGIGRGAARVVSADENGPLYGGTPSDKSVVQAIQELKARGFRVIFSPFILMDVPPGNELPDPYNPTEFQPAFPWRGRITVHPAPGVSGSPDKSSAAAGQVDAFFGGALRTQFSVSGTAVSYTGPADWGYRRFVLHYAHLCDAAGGVDGFLIGSELKGLTSVRSSASDYPAVAQLQTLAADVRAVLGGTTKITYAADWSEYSGHHPGDGSGDVFFNLDPLWADPDIDAVAIDYYVPLSDWRDGENHLDALAGARSIYERDYLQSNVEGGEGYDWYYANDADRAAQTRTPIADSAYGEPWVFRVKDIRAWWSSDHHNRPGGVRDSTPTAWAPESKPIWFAEFGCPAVDKGANQPNVFYDPKSSESLLPYFSSGARDDLMQRRFVEAVLSYWSDSANNPESGVYAGRMVDTDNCFAWAWDARPFPDFPLREEVWRDGPQWRLGHWLNGRLAEIPLGDLAAALIQGAGLDEIDVSGVTGLVSGYVVDRVMSPREALEPLMLAYAMDAAESEGVIRFRSRGSGPEIAFTPSDLCEIEPESPVSYRLTRAQETELPLSVKAAFIDALGEYRQSAVESRRLTVASDRVARAEFPIVLESESAQAIADRWLMETWRMRERAEFVLPPSRLALDPGDVVTLEFPDRSADFRLIEISDASGRAARAVNCDASLYNMIAGPARSSPGAGVQVYGAPEIAFLDLPLLTGAETPHAPHVAAFAEPWPGGIAVMRSPSGTGFALDTLLASRAVMGVTETDFYAGPAGRWDNGNLLWVKLYDGALQSRSALDVLTGANLAAVENADGFWEVIQFRNAELVDTNKYKLSGFLRGQAGTENEMRNPVAAGARFVLIDASLKQLALSLSERGLAFTYRCGPARLPYSDASYVEFTRSFAGIGLRPLSPCRLKAKRGAGGDIAITWTRRTRIGGDSWEAGDAPVGETMESYEIDIYDGADVIRTINAASPSAAYTAAQQVADFGSSSFSSLTLAVHQMSEIYGRGAPRKETLNV